MNSIYLDNAATTCIRKEVVDEMTVVLNSIYGNPSSTHSYGRKSKSIIEKCRKRIAAHFNVMASEIIFTSGGTEADNLVLRSAVYDLGVKHLITSRIEHHAVSHTILQLSNEKDIKVSYVNLLKNGSVNLDHLNDLLSASNGKTLVSLMHINNEIGTILDIKLVGNLCKKHDAYFHSDTVQSVGRYNLNLSEIPIDFLAASAHKFHGPKGIGFAFIRKGLDLKPIITGGSQERGYRAGTESVHDIVGLDLSLQIAHEKMKNESIYISELKSYFVERLKGEIPGVIFNGDSDCEKTTTYTILNVCFPVPREKAQLFLFELDLNSISCSTGSACQSGSNSKSHVLKEILAKNDLEKPSIRFSLSTFNTKAEIDRVIKVINTLVNKSIKIS